MEISDFLACAVKCSYLIVSSWQWILWTVFKVLWIQEESELDAATVEMGLGWTLCYFPVKLHVLCTGVLNPLQDLGWKNTLLWVIYSLQRRRQRPVSSFITSLCSTAPCNRTKFYTGWKAPFCLWLHYEIGSHVARKESKNRMANFEVNNEQREVCSCLFKRCTERATSTSVSGSIFCCCVWAEAQGKTLQQSPAQLSVGCGNYCEEVYQQPGWSVCSVGDAACVYINSCVCIHSCVGNVCMCYWCLMHTGAS